MSQEQMCINQQQKQFAIQQQKYSGISHPWQKVTDYNKGEVKNAKNKMFHKTQQHGPYFSLVTAYLVIFFPNYIFLGGRVKFGGWGGAGAEWFFRHDNNKNGQKVTDYNKGK